MRSLLLVMLLASTASAARLVTVGGTVTEIAFALGHGAEVVACDSSSVHPREAMKLPQVGYQRQISVEGVLAQKPTLILLTSEAGPPAAVAQLKSAGAPTVIIAGDNSVDGAKTRIRAVAAALHEEARGEKLIQTLDADMAAARKQIASLQKGPLKAIFVYARGAGTLMVAGRHTHGDSILRLAGATNAVDGFDGYRPLTAEALVAAQPDVIVIPKMGLDSTGGEAALWALPGLSLTPAGRNKRMASLDDLLLLGFGPRLGQAVQALATALYSSSK